MKRRAVPLITLYCNYDDDLRNGVATIDEMVANTSRNWWRHTSTALYILKSYRGLHFAGKVRVHINPLGSRPVYTVVFRRVVYARGIDKIKNPTIWFVEGHDQVNWLA